MDALHVHFIAHSPFSQFNSSQNYDSKSLHFRKRVLTPHCPHLRAINSVAFDPAEPSNGSIISTVQNLFKTQSNYLKNFWKFLDANYLVVEDFRRLVKLVNDLEPFVRQLSDSQLKAKTDEFRQRLKKGETLDDIQAEAFAVVREAARRVLGLRHFDVQIIGGGVLHAGAVAEMQTGEGKTLVATLAAYLNALPGEGVHVVTVNDYLAKRDADWMGKVHRFLGLTVGCLQSGMTSSQKRVQYQCDITYANNNDIGWDYLRDNLTTNKEHRVMRWPKPFYYALIDEIDSVVIDEGRNPLLISKTNPRRDAELLEYFMSAASIAASLVQHNSRGLMFTSETQYKTIALTELGVQHATSLLDRFWGEENKVTDFWDHNYSSYVLNALKAEVHYLKDRDYILVGGGERYTVKLLDEVSGRAVEKKWMHGIQQAVEAKEYLNGNQKVDFTPLQLPAARVAWQALVAMYPKRSGMTGTAKTEEREFIEGLGMPVVVIPTNRPCQRVDQPIAVYRTKDDKWRAVLRETHETYMKERPVLIGTTSVRDSQDLSQILKGFIPHAVLNAKPENAAREAEIVAQAGRRAMVTIATNMAGRGTDILLGGNPEMLAKGILMAEIRPYLLKNNGQNEVRGIRLIPLSRDTQTAIRKILTELLKDPILKVDVAQINSTLEKIVDKASTMSRIQLEDLQRSLQQEWAMAGAEKPRNDAWMGHEGESQFEIKEKQQQFEILLQIAFSYALQDCRLLCQRESEIVKRQGGLHVIGTELQASRRIDNQLRGRAGRQGDPGSTQFIISLQDNLFQEQLGGTHFALASSLLDKEGISIPAITAQLLWIQSHVDRYYQSWRREQSQFEEIQEGQRLHVYGLRQQVLESNQHQIESLLKQYIQAEIDEQVATCCDPRKGIQRWRLQELIIRVQSLVLPNSFEGSKEFDTLVDWTEEELLLALHFKDGTNLGLESALPSNHDLRWKRIHQSCNNEHNAEFISLLRYWLGSKAIEYYERTLEDEQIRRSQRRIALLEIDSMWRTHLVVMERLLSGVKIRGYAFVDPMEEYRIDTTRAFAAMLRKMLNTTVIKVLNQRLEWGQVIGESSADVDSDSDRDDNDHDIKNDEL